MAEKLSYDQIADKNLFDPLIKELNQVNKLLKETADELKGVAKEAQNVAENTPFDNVENIKKVEKAINNTKKSLEDLDEVESKREKLLKRLKGLEDDRAKVNAEIQLQIRQRTQQLKDEARTSAANASAYDKLSATLNVLRKRYKDAAAEGKQNTKENKQLLKEVVKLDKKLKDLDDTVGQNQRSVGKYERAIEGLTGKIKTFAAASGIAAVVALIAKFGEELNKNEQAANSFEKAISRVTITIQVIVRRLVKAFPLITELFNTFFDNVTKSAETFATKVAFNILKPLASFGLFKDEFANIVKTMAKGKDEARGYGDVWDDITDIFAGSGDEISKLIEKNDTLIDNLSKYRREIVANNKEIAELTKKQASQQIAADDATKSLQSQIKAQETLNKTNFDLNSLIVRNAKIEREIAREKRAIAGNSITSQEQEVEAITALAEARAELIANEEEGSKLIRELRRDQTERNLDFYIDDFDNQKTVNERIIADTTQTFDKRKELLELNKKLTKDSFAAQTAEINKNLIKQGLAEVDFTELVNEQSSKRIAEKIKESGLDDILAGRALEIIRERRTFIQDNAEAQRDLNKAEQEGREIQQIIEEQRKALNNLDIEGANAKEVLASLTERVTEKEIENLRFRLSELKEGSEDRIKLEKELNDKLLQQKSDALDKELEKEKKAEAERERLRQTGLSALRAFIEKQNEAKLEAIDKELESVSKQEERLRSLADKGVQNADENLALQQKRAAELEKQRQQQIRRQKLAELGLATIETYSAKVQAGDQNPFFSTITDITLLRSFIESLPAFYEGSEMVSNDLEQTVSGRDGYVVRVDGGERVLPTALNQVIPSTMSNYELAMIANKQEKAGTKNDLIVHKLDEVKNAIANKPVNVGMDYNVVEKMLTEIWERKGKITRKHISKKRGLFKN